LPDPLNSRNPPREVFAAHPEIFGDPLPIRGGWGYSMDDPVIIDRDDPIVPKGRRFDGVGVEYAFVDKRIHAELVFFRPPDTALVAIERKLLRQQLSSWDGRHFDVLNFHIKTLPQPIWNVIREANRPEDERNDLANRLATQLNQEFWFDITSFYGKIP
jgi:hypothetical protein